MIAGQSNGLSYIDRKLMNDSSVLRYSTSGKVILNKPLDHRDGFFIPTKENPTDYSIAWLYCAEAIVRSTGRKVVIVNMARDSSSTTYWASEYLEDFLKAIAYFKPKVILWHQGEADDKYGIPQEVSEKNMRKVINATKIVSPDLTWVIAINSMHKPFFNAPIRQAQHQIISERLALKGPDTDQLRLDLHNMDDENLHFIGIGAKKHGLMWYEVLKKYHLI